MSNTADAYLDNLRASPVSLGIALRLSGEIDLSNAQDLKDALDEGLEVGGPILIDVSELSFIDSAGVHVWMQAAEALKDRGCSGDPWRTEVAQPAVGPSRCGRHGEEPPSCSPRLGGAHRARANHEFIAPTS